MNIGNLVNELKKGNKLELIPVTSFKVKCPYCGEEIVKYKIENNKISYDIWRNLDGEGYTYSDGDTVLHTERKINLTFKQFDTEMLQGQCKKCDKQYVGISIDIISKPVDDDCFYIGDDEILYEDNVTSELFQVNINGNKIGVLSIFNDVNFINSQCNIYRMDLGSLELSTDLRGEYGVACCSLDEEQCDIWDSATELCQYIINDFTNNYSYLKE